MAPLASDAPGNDPPLVSELCQLRVEGGRLVLHSQKSIAGGMACPEVQLRDLPGQSNIRILKNTDGSDRPDVFYLINTNTKVPGANMVQTQITLNAGQLVVHQHFQAENAWRIVSVVQGANIGARGASAVTTPGTDGVTFMVMRSEDGRNQTFRADNWAELRREHPDEVDRYLRPLFKWLRQDAIFGVEPVVAWQVLSEEWNPAPAMTRRVDALIVSLDAERYAQRRDAETQLEAEGFGAALYLARRGLTGCSAEQRQRLTAVLSKYPVVTPENAAKMAHDPDFLIDCLYSSDATVREVAQRRLTGISPRVAVLPAPGDPDRISTIESLRSELVPRAAVPPTFDDDPAQN